MVALRDVCTGDTSEAMYDRGMELDEASSTSTTCRSGIESSGGGELRGGWGSTEGRGAEGGFVSDSASADDDNACGGAEGETGRAV